MSGIPMGETPNGIKYGIFDHDEKFYTLKIKVKFKPTLGGDSLPQIVSANIAKK